MLSPLLLIIALAALVEVIKMTFSHLEKKKQLEIEKVRAELDLEKERTRLLTE